MKLSRIFNRKRRKTSLPKITTSTNIHFYEKKFIEGTITKDEWSRMTFAMRIHLMRFFHRYKKLLKKKLKKQKGK